MQIKGSAFRSVTTCARTVYQTEGLTAFYISYPTTLMMSVPFTAVQFTAYESIKQVLNPGDQYSPITHVTAGGMAGGIAAAITTPLDVAKTLLQTRGTSEDSRIRNARGMRDAFKIIYERNGLKGFTRGLTPRVVTFMPSNALCWLCYEFFSELIVSLLLSEFYGLMISRNDYSYRRWKIAARLVIIYSSYKSFVYAFWQPFATTIVSSLNFRLKSHSGKRP